MGRRAISIISAAFDPKRTDTGQRFRSAAGLLAAVLVFRLGTGGAEHRVSIQNNSGLAQGLATRSAAG